MVIIAGFGVTCLPVTVMSIRLLADVAGAGLVGEVVTALVAVPVAVLVAAPVVGATTGLSVGEQDARTTAALRALARVRGPRRPVIFVTMRSLGRVLTP
jgi:hypothetical protein